jgi:glycosyltransferase involved in cell wall biosynthesis
MERSVQHLARHLQRRGIATVLYTRPATQPGTFPGDVVTVPYERFRVGTHGRVLDRTLNYPGFVRRLGAAVADEVRAGRVDVVHAQGITALGYGRWRARDPRLRAPLILNPQGMEEHKTRGLKRLALTLLRRLSLEAARLADRVIATDEVTRHEVPFYLKVDPARVVVLPNAVDLEEIAQATPPEARAIVRQALPSLQEGAGPVLISVGRIERYKGFGDVLEALVRLHSASRLPPRWAWLLLGEGLQRVDIERRIAEYDLTHAAAPLTPHIHFAGWVRTDPLLHAFYACSDVFVHATHYEGSSIVTLEAMAHGLPVVATRTGGIPDKVLSGESGLLVEPRDVTALTEAIAAVAGDEERRRAMGSAGRRRVRELFSWDAVAARTIAVYEELLRAS